jgi:hypothetical protein
VNIEDVLRGHGIGVGSGGGGGHIITFQNTVTISAPTNTVAHGISIFDRAKGTMLVVQNKTLATENNDYFFSSDNTSIVKKNGTWDAQTTFTFLVLSSAPTIDALKTICLEKFVTSTADGTTHILIAMPEYDADNDIIKLFLDNSMLYKTDNYTVTGTGVDAAIDLVGFSLKNGDKVLIQVWKKVREDLANLQDAITTVRLTNAVTVPLDNSTHFNIGVPTFNKDNDVLDVYFKNDYLYPVTQYTMGGDGVSIDLVGTPTVQNDIVYFVVHKKVLSNSVALQDIMTTVNLTNLVTIAADNTTIVNIGIPEYNKDTDLLDVIFDHGFLAPVSEYTVNSTGTQVTLVTPANAGKKVLFRVWKKVRTDFPKYSGISFLSDDSILNRFLHPDAKVGSVGSLMTNAQLSATDAINEVVKGNNFNVYRSGKDSNGIFTVVDIKRFDGTLFQNSTLSNPDVKNNYQTEVIKTYDRDGVTVLGTVTFTVAYDAGGDMTSRVKQ